jgi:hypothetical protein
MDQLPQTQGKPSTVTKRPDDLPYRYQPPKLKRIPRNVPLGSKPDHEAQILQAIECGQTMHEIAEQIGRDVSILSRWLADPQRAAKAKESRRLQAVYWDELAERTIKELPSNATPAAMLRARELASHYRWRAKSIAPHDYGDRPLIDAEQEAQRQAQALNGDTARLVLGGILAAIGLQVSELPKDRAGRVIDHDSTT